MKRKLVSIFIIILFITQSVFANISNLAKVQLVSPIVSASGDVSYATSLNVTLKLTGEVDGNMTIMRIDDPTLSFAIQSKIATTAPTARYSLSYDGAPSQDEIVTIDFSSIYDSTMTHAQIESSYASEAELLSAAYNRYNDAYQAALKKYSISSLDNAIKHRLLKSYQLYDLHSARQEYEKHAILFLKIQAKYFSLFKSTVASNISVQQQGALPYFNYVLNDVKVGRYEISVIDTKTGDALMSVARFNVKSQPDAGEDNPVKADVLRSDLIKIWPKN